MVISSHVLITNLFTRWDVVDSRVNTQFIFEDAADQAKINENVLAGFNETSMHPGMELKGIEYENNKII